MATTRAPEKLVFFGKGGSGKSTLSSNLSAIYARSGLKVLHVGCDPKRDSTALLVERPEARSVLSRQGEDLGVAPASEFLMRSRLGLDCIEAGGPEPGVGCAGRGISKMIEVLHRDRIIERGGYDVVTFDVLGDVVCGGFAAPLRLGFGEKVVIVVSEEAMSLYAANNIAHAVRNYSGNGVGLCGLVANLRDPGADVGLIERFAARIGTSVVGVVGRDLAFREAESRERCLTEIRPRPKALKNLEEIAEKLRKMDRNKLTVPEPMDEAEFYEANRDRFSSPRRPLPARGPVSGTIPDAVRGEAAKAPSPERPSPPRDLDAVADGAAPAPPYTRWLMWTWGVEDQWRQFFANPELELNSAKPLLRDTAFVVQKELECFFVEARSDDGTAGFFNHPWPDHTSNVLPLPFELRRLGSRQLVADIKDGEVIMGGSRKMEAAMAGLAADPGKTGLAVFLTSCPAVVIGDDNAAVMERFRLRSGIPTLFPDRDRDQHTDLLADLFALAPRTARRDAGPRVNLVGFPRDRSLTELTALLAMIGVEVNSVLLPEFDRESVARYGDADLQVIRPYRAYEDLTADLFAKLPVPALVIEPPYGVEGTRRWLAAIAKSLELRLDWDALSAPYRARWDALRARAAGRTLGFICDAERLALLRDCRHSAGVPLLSAVREMGFRLEWLLWCPCGGKTKHPAKDKAGERETIRRFHSKKELDALLRSRPIDAVYSDLFFDTRLTRAGKSQFSLPYFEPGLDGALRTVERLLGTAELPLYKGYARYLAEEDHV
ncbi:MAG: AAA family ATPase [Elusimicrobia bacterium]|nr:AAA family ATPase [Elusimicrobiota bacterium]